MGFHVRAILVLLFLLLADLGLKSLTVPEPLLPEQFNYAPLSSAPMPSLFRSFGVGTAMDAAIYTEGWEDPSVDCSAGCEPAVPILSL